ncbi:stage II sporulation protein M [Alkalihalobacillus pseudalcaliphilus]|uniref:stage II sporulation protein M n=1 Tax=Alkalihalobacillus pseudalcaliphilus TaxID=79884 RepID=UPI00235F9E2E|nr:stage II sporulation protein M [Alkalihalobacillus pseudalcaliphilus]
MRTNSFKYMVMSHIEENRSLYIFTTVLFLMGIIFGAIVVNSMSLTQRHDLHLYVSQFFGQVSEGHMTSSAEIFATSFMHYIKYIGLMWLLGLSVIGLPVLLILLFLKGVVVGFTIGFLVNQLGLQGFLLSFAAVMPQNFILIPVFIIIGTAGTAFCVKMMRQQFFKKQTVPFMPQFVRYSLLMLCLGGAVAFASFCEAYLSPILMKFIITTFM